MTLAKNVPFPGAKSRVGGKLHFFSMIENLIREIKTSKSTISGLPPEMGCAHSFMVDSQSFRAEVKSTAAPYLWPFGVRKI